MPDIDALLGDVRLAELNLKHLRTVTEIIRHGGISAAAHAVHLTQPAITQGIAKLERQLDITLFHRLARHVEPTEAGLLLSSRVEAAVGLIGHKHVTSSQIRAFTALVQYGSYVTAACETGLAEASLHRAVSELSQLMGCKLLERRGRGVIVTADGIRVARHLGLAVAEIRAAIEELDALKGRQRGKIVIGAMPLARAQLLPMAIKRFQRQLPEVQVAIREGAHKDLVTPLRTGEIDIMVGALRETLSADLLQNALFEDPPVVIAGAGHPLGKVVGEIDLGALRRFPWVVSGGETPLRAMWNQIFASEPPPIAVECGSTTMICELLVDSPCLSMVSRHQVMTEITSGRLIELCQAPGSGSRTIGLTSRSDWRPTYAQRLFVNILHEVACSYI